jgi:hypothetical protein
MVIKVISHDEREDTGWNESNQRAICYRGPSGNYDLIFEKKTTLSMVTSS